MSISPFPARHAVAALALLAVLGAAGCGSHYKVTDPASGKTYYTTDVDRERNGTIRFKDARSSSKVTLTSSEVKKISKSEYKAGVDAK